MSHVIAKVYTYKDSAGDPCFYYENESVPTELSEYTYDWDISNIPDGQHTLIARTVDRAGNWSADTLHHKNIDRIPFPTVLIS